MDASGQVAKRALAHWANSNAVGDRRTKCDGTSQSCGGPRRGRTSSTLQPVRRRLAARDARVGIEHRYVPISSSFALTCAGILSMNSSLSSLASRSARSSSETARRGRRRGLATGLGYRLLSGFCVRCLRHALRAKHAVFPRVRCIDTAGWRFRCSVPSPSRHSRARDSGSASTRVLLVHAARASAPRRSARRSIGVCQLRA